MSDVLLILSTFPNLIQARQIGTLLVERQLAACVNLIPAVESIYRWQGSVESSTEVLAIFKTRVGGFQAFSQALTELHPYQVPEIIAVNPIDLSEAYRSWVINNVELPDQSPETTHQFPRSSKTHF
jgi:periplasmic divalent cation tolerance protein